MRSIHPLVCSSCRRSQNSPFWPQLQSRTPGGVGEGCQRSQTLSSVLNLYTWIFTHLCVSLWCLQHFPHQPRPLQKLGLPKRSLFSLPVRSGGERTHFSALAAYISTQRGNGHENRLKPMCNGKFIPLWPWTRQASREIHRRFFFKIRGKSFLCVRSGDVAGGMEAW